MNISPHSSGYKVSLWVFGKQRHVGCAPTAPDAAKLADSALFHLWGWIKNPKAGFNLYRSGAATPELLPKVEKLRGTLISAAQSFGLNPAEYCFTFAQRNDFPKPTYYPT